MGSILLAYATGEGQTARIAARIADSLETAGHAVTVEEVTERGPPATIGDVDAVVVGSSIHVGTHQDWIVEFVRENLPALRAVPGAFFQVSLSAASDDEARQADATTYIENFVKQTGWQPTHVGNFAGAIRYSQYGFVKRQLMRLIARSATGDTDTSRDYEYTDWDAVESFAADVATMVEQPSDSGGLVIAGSKEDAREAAGAERVEDPVSEPVDSATAGDEPPST